MMETNRTADYLAAYRKSVAPVPTRRQANLARMRERIDQAVSEPEEAEPPRMGRAASFALVVKSVSLSLVLGGAGLGAIKLGAMAVTNPAPVAEPIERPAPAETPRATAPARSAPTAAKPAPAQSAPAAAEEPATLAPIPVTPTARPPARAPVRGRVSPPMLTPDRLRAEVNLMQRIAAAVEQGQWVTALNLTAEHQRSFSDGALVEERRAWRTIAKCGLGKPEGRARAAEFAAAYPRSPLVGRVNKACPRAAAKRISTDR